MRKIIATLLIGAALAGSVTVTPAVAEGRGDRAKGRYEHQQERLKDRRDRERLKDSYGRREEWRDRRDRNRRYDRDYGYYGRGYDRDPNDR